MVDAKQRLVQTVDAFRLRMPLVVPYAVSDGRFDHYDMFLARVLVDGSEGVGETVVAPGYSPETGSMVWKHLQQWANRFPGTEAESCLRAARSEGIRNPFCATPVATALEAALGLFKIPADISVDLVGTVMTHEPSQLALEVEQLLADGYGTLKVKVGWNAELDAARVRTIQQTSNGRAKLRIDANRGYDFREAVYFANHIDPQGVEVFEQPLEVDAWDELVPLSRKSPLPLMLDESIASEEDLDRAIELGCLKAVKFKLMKAGSTKRLTELIASARGSGLQVVLGNGLAGDIGDFHEVAIAGQQVDWAGEMNGFLKQTDRLLTNPYSVTAGRVELPAGYAPEVNWAAVEGYAVDSLSSDRARGGLVV